MEIAIIDTGLNTILDSGREIDGISINEKGEVSNLFGDNIGHGTGVISLLDRIIPTNIDFFVIRLYDYETEVNPCALIEALKYLKDRRSESKIIHMSLGIGDCDEIKQLKESIDNLVSEGRIVVAAYANEGTISYPAAFSNVIGVSCGDIGPSANEYIYCKNSIVNVIMGIGNYRVKWNDGSYRYVSGASFSATYITSVIAYSLEKLLYEGETAVDLPGVLERNAKKVVNNQIYKAKEIGKWRIKKAIALPFNKEIHALYRFRNMLNFELDGIYEPILMGRVGNKLNEIIKSDRADGGFFSIKNEGDINWQDDFDTVILGHVGKISDALGRDINEEIVEKCLKYHKNLYSFDKIKNFEKRLYDFSTRGLNIFYPRIIFEGLLGVNMGKLFDITSPVLCVAGTSPKQGKFSLQLKLRKMLNDRGYNIGQLGTEPSSLLFGIDEVYPMGYEADNKIYGDEAVTKINNLMHSIDNKNVDLIIVGLQSQTIPLSYGNTFMYPIQQSEIVLGALPDAFILCTNIYDDLEYIKRTKLWLESYIDSKVIAIGVFSAVYSEIDGELTSVAEDEVQERLNCIEEFLGIMTFEIGKETNDLIREIENFFS